MSGFLDRLSRRTLGEASGLALRRRARFEPAPGMAEIATPVLAEGPAGETAPAGEIAADPVSAQLDHPPARPVEQQDRIPVANAAMPAEAAPAYRPQEAPEPAAEQPVPPGAGPSRPESRPNRALPPAPAQDHARKPEPAMRPGTPLSAQPLPVSPPAPPAFPPPAPARDRAAKPPASEPDPEAVRMARPPADARLPARRADVAPLPPPARLQGEQVQPAARPAAPRIPPLPARPAANEAARETSPAASRRDAVPMPDIPAASPVVTPQVEVRIGRMEIRANAPPPAAKPRRASALSRLPSLADYLARPRGR
jgi:hypothetical protein